MSLSSCLPKTYLLLAVVAVCFNLGISKNNPPVLLNFASIRVLVKPEDTPVNSTLGNLTARDDDGPMEVIFSITDPATQNLVRLSDHYGDSATGRTVNIILISPLDRDREPIERKLYFNLADGDSSVDHNSMPVQVSLFITDVNDEVPEFTNRRYKESVYENVPVGTTLNTQVTAIDPDNGIGGTVTYSMQPVAQAADDAYRNAFRIDPNHGNIIVNGQLDYEKHNFYEFTIKAKDGYNKESKFNAEFVVTIKDIQDTAPAFFNLPYSVVMPEDKAVGETVLQVTALDGDRGIPNAIRYRFASGDYQNFVIDASSGLISINHTLDRDDPIVQQRGGVYAMEVEASEVTSNVGNTTATTLVTITVSDVNDNAPQFNSNQYEATILENMQNGVPVSFIGANTILSVNDKDQGSNSHFELMLMKNGLPYYDFSPLPSEVFSESSILIRVNNSANLDYEKMTSTTFQIVAREIGTTERRSSTATITVHIEDMNDNQPIFNQTSYLGYVLENSPPGTSIVTIHATDDDSGIKGNISYSLRGGNGRFTIDSNTGLVTLIGEMDREKITEYYLTAEARDGGGFRSTIELHVIVRDANDNAPVFVRDEYFSTIKEKGSSFLRGPLKVEATDVDDSNTNNSHVQYRIVGTSPGLQNNFTINAITGEINLVTPLDYEKLDRSLQGKVVLEVQAFDLGSPSQFTSINVTIEVEDVNDNIPQFEQTTYSGILPENATYATVAVRTKAHDLDGTAPNNEFVYRIDSGAQDKFRINFTSGEISVEVGAKLNREDKDVYVLNVSATDRGAVSLAGFCVVTINVTDVNDYIPVFNPDSRSQLVHENLPVNSSVFTFTAEDKDLNKNLHYSIIPGSVTATDDNGDAVDVTTHNIQNYFGVHPHNGTVYVKSRLDREAAELVLFKLLVQDLNAWDPPKALQTATATITITLLDDNDNSPTFVPSSTYFVNVSEGRQLMENILTLLATDADKNQEVRYSIGADVTNSFIISDPTSGTVRLRRQLDRELESLVTFTVLAIDNGSPPLTSTATIFISVTDSNDNSPVFGPYQTLYTISEDVGNGTEVAVISATDQDKGNFSKIVYSLDVFNDDGSFKIDSDTGRIVVSKDLDFETRSTYSIKVGATDNPFDLSNQRSVQTQSIRIEILDINDNAPIILNSGTKPKSILENAYIGSLQDTVVETVSATDPDDGDNGRVEYLLDTSNTNASANWFDIRTVYNPEKQSNEGIIVLRENLLGKVGIYYVTVTARDHGSPMQLSSSKTLLFEVVDVNLHQPQFVSPQGPRATIQIKEEQPKGYEVLVVKASDEDHGLNAEIEYFLSHEKDYLLFQLNKDTGLLITNATLDRETKSDYELKIIASDKGKPNVLQNSITLFIQLLDKNDHEPEFNVQMPYRVGSVLEEVDSAHIGGVNVAEDQDSDANNTIIFYYILGGEMQDHFKLNRTTGQLYLVGKIDRENAGGPPINFINLIIKASPTNYLTDTIPDRKKRSVDESLKRNKRSTSPNLPPAGYDPSDKTQLWVQVIVQDVDDHPPEFQQKNLSIGITRKTQFGEIILNLKDEVRDPDIGNNSVHVYELSSFTSDPADLITTVGADSFKLFPNGTIKSNTYFKSDIYGYFVMDVKVKDSMGKFDTAQVKISLINDDQRLKVIFRMTPEQVRNFSTEFKNRLERITGYRIVVDKIQTHENADGKPEVDKTDMFIHGEKINPFAIVDAAELLSKIDSKATELIPVLNDYNILQIVPTASASKEEDTSRTFIMAIVLLAILLGIPCIVMIIVIFLVRQKYKRKLKAATAMAYASRGIVQGQDSDLQKLQLPGTNIHAYENANPIFLEKVLLEESGEMGRTTAA